MKKLNLAIAVLASAAILTGCALGKMIKLADDQDLQVNPSPLEVHGGSVPFEVSAVLPPKMLPTGKVYTINTIYQYGDQETEVGAIEFKAEDFPNSSSSTSRKSENFSMPYQDAMNPGTLYVQGVASDPRNGKSKSTARMEVAKGLITTSLFAKDIVMPALADHGYNDREELVPTNVDFYFEQGRSVLKPSLSTDGTTNQAKTKNLSAFIADKNVTRTVTITGMHSPEGSETINTNLASDRASAIEKWYRTQMKKYDYKGLADSVKFILKPVVRDYSSLKAAVREADFIEDSEKQSISRIVDGTGSFEDKEKQLQKLSIYKEMFDKIYPTLRTAKTEILTVKDKKANAEIAVISKKVVNGDTTAESLSQEELLFSATLTPSLDEKEAIYKEATKSGAWQAHNNLGATLLAKASIAEGADRSKLIEDAITQLEIAQNKQEGSPEVLANVAAGYILQGEYGQALEAITAAEGASPSNALNAKIKAMKGAIQLKQGSYEEARTSFGAAEKTDAVTFDLGLTHILTKEYDAAGGTLDKVLEAEDLGAEAAYLKAVTSARQNDASGVTSNLQTAVAKDPALKEKALSDLEFANYADAVAQAVK